MRWSFRLAFTLALTLTLTTTLALTCLSLSLSLPLTLTLALALTLALTLTIAWFLTFGLSGTGGLCLSLSLSFRRIAFSGLLTLALTFFGGFSPARLWGFF